MEPERRVTEAGKEKEQTKIIVIPKETSENKCASNLDPLHGHDDTPKED